MIPSFNNIIQPNVIIQQAVSIAVTQNSVDEKPILLSDVTDEDVSDSFEASHVVSSPSSDELVAKMILRKNLPHLVLDKCRSRLYKHLAENLLLLMRGGLVGRNRFNILILGKKASGKTSLLESTLQGFEFLRSYTNESLVAVHVSCSKKHHRLPLYQQAANHLAYQLNISSPLIEDSPYSPDPEKQLAEFAIQNNARILFLIDEFQLVYGHTWSKEESENFIESLADLCESNSGRFFLIVTGSSSELDRLAFGKVPVDTSKWPHYQGRDLNSTKLNPHWLLPFQDVTEFADLSKSYKIPDDHVLQAYYQSAE